MKTLITILIILTIASYYFAPIIRSIMISKDIETNTVPFFQIKKDAEFKILVVGDSTAFGTGAKDPNNSIAGRFGQDYPESEIINISENGLKISELVEILEKHLANNTYDYIHIQIGANDIILLSSYNKVEESLVELLDLVTEKSEFVTILTAGDVGESHLFKYPISSYLSKRTREIRNIFMSTIKEYETVRYVDLYSRTEMNETIQNNPNKYYARDNFHPNDLTYGEWYKAIKEVIER